jgi:mxaJ protein
MSSRCLSLLSLLYVGAACAQPLRICADPDNIPFSNRTQQGFDNRIATLIARDLGREPVFVWARTGQGFVREVFNKNACDVLMGVPAKFDRVMTTTPYYRSSYVFVTPSTQLWQITTFSDPKLNGKKIGLQRLQDDYSPASLPLIRNGHAAQLVGFSSFGDAEGDVVRAVADGRVGLSVVWGPVAGYFAARDHLRLRLTPVADTTLPFAYSMSIGVHKNDAALKQAIDASIHKLQPKIDRILQSDHVPLLPMEGGEP